MSAAMIAIGWIAMRSASRAPQRGVAAEPDGASMVALGDELLSAGVLDAADDVTRFRLDGIAVSALSGRSDAAFEGVLRAAAARCAIEAPIDPVALARSLRAPTATSDGAPAGSATTSLAIEGSHGFVACLDRFAAPPSRGALRYVYARRDDEGARFAVVWTDTVVRLADLARAEDDGDVVGSDVPDLPRPPGARRRFSFVREDGRDQLVVYDLTDARSDVERWAGSALPAAGWSAPRASGGEAERGEDGDRVLVADREGRRVHLVLRTDGTMVVIATQQAR